MRRFIWNMYDPQYDAIIIMIHFRHTCVHMYVHTCVHTCVESRRLLVELHQRLRRNIKGFINKLSFQSEKNKTDFCRSFTVLD